MGKLTVKALTFALVAAGSCAPVVAAGGEEERTAVPVGRPAPAIRLEVDATDLSRKLLRASMSIEVEPGPTELHYVLWTPGNHSPSGPIRNLVDLTIRDCQGEPLEWRRDPVQVTRFSMDVPEGCNELRIDLAYIAGEPTTTSRSTDSYGMPTFGGINWNTVLLYPDGYSNQQITVRAALAVPAEWKVATSLPEFEQGGAAAQARMREISSAHWVDFAEVSLAQLIDSPVIAGEHLASHALTVEGVHPHWLHLVAADPEFVELPGWLETKLERMIKQALAIFHPVGQQQFPRDRYHFLCLLGDDLRFGVEHATSTFIGSREDLISSAAPSPGKGGGAKLSVLPHEYFHAWCAKLAAPEGLVRQDYHTPPVTDLLWVYEGLTTYYTGILSVRSGLTSRQEFRDAWRDRFVEYQMRSGRLWRPVVDTARAAGPLRGRGIYWANRRQGQEYYGQGALFWLEADALIRRGTEGNRSLDDFCAALFDVPALPIGAHATYTRQTVVDALTGTYRGVDWDRMIRERLERPQDTLDLSPLLEMLGARLTFSDTPSSAQRKALSDSKDTDLSTSLGFSVDKKSLISDIVPGSPADVARIAYGMEILAVDGRSFTHEHLRQAVAGTGQAGRVELTVQFGQRVETITIPYDAGPRFPRLERIETQADILGAIARPRRFGVAR